MSFHSFDNTPSDVDVQTLSWITPEEKMQRNTKKGGNPRKYVSEREIPPDDIFDAEVLAILNRVRKTHGVVKNKYGKKKRSSAEQQAEADAADADVADNAE